MSLSAKYQQFLAKPSTAVLAEKASIHYITTLTTINEPTAIIKHLSAQAKQLEKKSEKLLSAIESSNGLCLDVETTLEFTSGGGAFLPGLDDNFLADRTVTFPVVRLTDVAWTLEEQSNSLYPNRSTSSSSTTSRKSPKSVSTGTKALSSSRSM